MFSGCRILAEVEYFDRTGNVERFEFSPHAGIAGTYQETTIGLAFSVVVEEHKDWTEIIIPVASLCETDETRLKSIVLFPGLVGACEGDGGALVLPLDSGRLCYSNRKASHEYIFPHFRTPKVWEPYWSNMNVIGAYAKGRARAAVIGGGCFDAKLRVRTNWEETGRYSVDAVFYVRDFRDDTASAENISLTFAELDGDYRAIAGFYREYNQKERRLPTLKEKASNNQDLDYSSKAMTVRCRMGVKPLPCQIPEQTPENEPSVKPFMTFADIREIADEFAAQHVGPCEFCLVGWNHGGHDGAFPQLFPVEEACGGDLELRKTIEHVRHLGFHISLHDNYFDAYTLARNFDPADICILHDGKRALGGGLLAGGQAYRICAKPAQEKYATENLPECSEMGINGAYFVDVISIIGLEKCYDPKHPLTRRENAEYYKKILHMQQEYFEVAMSEGARDWALPELDRAYMVLNCVEVPLGCADEVIPMFQMVYRGYLIYNNFREGINSVPGERLYLLNLAWGGLPLIYFHHLFHPEWSADSGWSKDLTYEGKEKLSADTRVIKRISDDVARLAPLRYLGIRDFVWHCDGMLGETIFSDSSRLWSNFSDCPVTSPDGTRVPANDFAVH